jgi:hypothetical protein
VVLLTPLDGIGELVSQWQKVYRVEMLHGPLLVRGVRLKT